MFRMIENELIAWKTDVNRKPLIIRGARQVGKSYVVTQFGRTHFETLVEINFELSPQLKGCFEQLNPLEIIDALELLTGKNIVIGKTLLFLDEIQQCPNAIVALRYFKEKLPELHVIAAGSLLEFTLADASYQQPVGRVQSLYMKPLSFQEFLLACGDKKLVDFLASVHIGMRIAEPIHDLLLEKSRQYFILGGMPEVIAYYVMNKQLAGCERIQATLLEYYRRDFSKYGTRVNSSILERIYSKVPTLIAKRFKYASVDPDIVSRAQKPPLQALIDAGLVYKVNHTSACGLPLHAGMNEKMFKLLFLDIGLAKHASGMDIETLFNQDLLLINNGVFAEQFVGQELLAYSKAYLEAQLFYWERAKKNSSAEVDYVLNIGSRIVPLEVKSGKTGRLKSLQVFLDEKKLDVGLRVSQHKFSFERRILSIPLYMIHEIPRLIGAL
jgi:uncharacterized protein